MDAEQERQERLYAEDKVRLKAERRRKEIMDIYHMAYNNLI